ARGRESYQPHRLNQLMGPDPNASIFTAALNGTEKFETESACEKIQNRYLCFEVVEAPFSGADEVDGVSGCFEAEIDAKLVSYSFGRGTLIPDTLKNTFSATASKSDQSCEERGLGLTQ
ncbi:hypothetical protein, partial [Planktotalea sp.]|uniref:hypothetical protein n=1 Tax=Planktotalea sp. TaxID=2029877 RepID=UPI0025FE06C3